MTFDLGETFFAGVINWGLRGELDGVRGVAAGGTFRSTFSEGAADLCTLSLTAAGGGVANSTAGERTTRECELRRRVGVVPKSWVFCGNTGATSSGAVAVAATGCGE